MSDNEREKYTEEREKVKDVLRDEVVKHYPIIIKASSAGTLETLIHVAQRAFHQNHRVHI